MTLNFDGWYLGLVQKCGYDIHYMNLSTGNCGSIEHDSNSTTRIRMREAQDAAKILGAEFHPPICNDFEIFYEIEALKKLTAVIRQVKPNVILPILRLINGGPYEYKPVGLYSRICTGF